MQVRISKRVAFKDSVYQPGEVVTVPDDVGRRWGRRGLATEVVYAPPVEVANDGLDLNRMSVAELREFAAEFGIETKGLNKKALIAAVADAYNKAELETEDEGGPGEGDESEGEESSEGNESEDE